MRTQERTGTGVDTGTMQTVIVIDSRASGAGPSETRVIIFGSRALAAPFVEQLHALEIDYQYHQIPWSQCARDALTKQFPGCSVTDTLSWGAR